MMFMVLKKVFKCGQTSTAEWWALIVALKIARITAFDAFWSTALATSKSGATNKNFALSLTSFRLMNICLSLDCKFCLENVNSA